MEWLTRKRFRTTSPPPLQILFESMKEVIQQLPAAAPLGTDREEVDELLRNARRLGADIDALYGGGDDDRTSLGGGDGDVAAAASDDEATFLDGDGAAPASDDEATFLDAAAAPASSEEKNACFAAWRAFSESMRAAGATRDDAPNDARRAAAADEALDGSQATLRASQALFRDSQATLDDAAAPAAVDSQVTLDDSAAVDDRSAWDGAGSADLPGPLSPAAAAVHDRLSREDIEAENARAWPRPKTTDGRPWISVREGVSLSRYDDGADTQYDDVATPTRRTARAVLASKAALAAIPEEADPPPRADRPPSPAAATAAAATDAEAPREETAGHAAVLQSVRALGMDCRTAVAKAAFTRARGDAQAAVNLVLDELAAAASRKEGVAARKRRRVADS